jgi:hypothetical protein
VVEPVVDSVVMVIEDESILQREQEPILFTLGKMKELLKQNIPKEYFRFLL